VLVVGCSPSTGFSLSVKVSLCSRLCLVDEEDSNGTSIAAASAATAEPTAATAFVGSTGLPGAAATDSLRTVLSVMLFEIAPSRSFGAVA
jgi:hypothetical protein